MINQADSQNNAHPPVNLCADPPWLGFPNMNWGPMIGAGFSVVLDPQLDVRRDLTVSRKVAQVRSPRVVMDQLTDEFAELNDDLLGELAR